MRIRSESDSRYSSGRCERGLEAELSRLSRTAGGGSQQQAHKTAKETQRAFTAVDHGSRAKTREEEKKEKTLKEIVGRASLERQGWLMPAQHGR